MIGEHRPAIARTLRETFGVGLSDLGDGVTWGEAKLLIEAAAGDGSTAFGAELAGWAYPASFPELLTIMGAFGDPRAAKKVMPWNLAMGSRAAASAEEIAQLDAELEAEFVFAE